MHDRSTLVKHSFGSFCTSATPEPLSLRISMLFAVLKFITLPLTRAFVEDKQCDYALIWIHSDLL